MPDPLSLSPPQQRKLAAFMDSICDIFPCFFRRDGCIAAARLAVDILAELHVPVRPLSVVVNIFNAGLVARGTREGGRPPRDQEEYLRWQQEDGAWWITLGAADAAPEAGKWAGHVVAVAWGRVLIDVTLPQVNRPHRGIGLPPLVVEVGPDFLAGREPRILNVNGCELDYKVRIGDASYMTARDWRDRTRTSGPGRAILARVRDDLRAAPARRR